MLLKYIINNDLVLTGNSRFCSYLMNLDEANLNGSKQKSINLIFEPKNNVEFSKEIYEFYNKIKNIDINSLEIIYINEKNEEFKVFDSNNYSNIIFERVAYDNKMNSINTSNPDSPTFLERIILIFNF